LCNSVIFLNFADGFLCEACSPTTCFSSSLFLIAG
jgi:hypothetical protein